jgi:hypothetical protein
LPYIQGLEQLPYSLFDIIVIGQKDKESEPENLFQYYHAKNREDERCLVVKDFCFPTGRIISSSKESYQFAFSLSGSGDKETFQEMFCLALLYSSHTSQECLCILFTDA